ncbi:MAG: processing protein [Actinomycetota bacterium]|jgi:predicted Rossmann fold nucleotide-binding protein DprA/Smf involved in DNA uptake|nr:processing protein [Actinomycetota bacterium]
MKSEDSLATVLLVSRLVSEGLQPLKAAEFWRLQSQVGTVSVLLGRSEDQLVREAGLASDLARRVVELLGRATAMAFELEHLEQAGISTVTPSDELYPPRFLDRLGSKAPPVVHAAGALDLLRRHGLGVVGSRDVDPEGAEIAKAAAGFGARMGLSLVSGGARGVDRLAMGAAYQADGPVVGVLADSLVRTLKIPDVRRAVYDGKTVMCTPYGPDAPFSAGNAMGRNKLIYAQSLVTFVVASDLGKGGTWSGAVEALKDEIGRVGVWRGAGEGPGNAEIEGRGAAAVRSIDDLESLLRTEPPDGTPRVRPTQPSLFTA